LESVKDFIAYAERTRNRKNGKLNWSKNKTLGDY